MPSCQDQYWADLDACDATYQQEKLACQGDPECINQAVLRRQACEQAAYLKYIQCIGQQGSVAPPPSASRIGPTPTPEGAPDCGCG